MLNLHWIVGRSRRERRLRRASLLATGAGLSNGTHSDDTLSVTISNLTDDSFDWISNNIGVDAVVVKGGAAGSYLYRYDPTTESTGDTGLTVPNPQNNGIGHISFCYDVEPAPTGAPSLSGTANGGSHGSDTWSPVLALAVATPMLVVIPLGRLRRRR